ncbi:MAG: LamG-like jellyroll fold domain-containing protein, partial [Promethearchaeota archaeon]
SKTFLRRKVILFSLLIALFFSSIIFNNISQIEFNSNKSNYYKDESIDFQNPKISGTQINITTPENKTYYEPMSGYYPATYGFENDENGDYPFGWKIEEFTGTKVQIVDEIDGHMKVVELYDDVEPYKPKITNDFLDRQTGTIEFWFRITSHDVSRYISIYEKGTYQGILLKIDELENILYFNDSESYQNMNYILKVEIWHHFTITFDCSNDWHLWIDGESIDGGIGFPFYGNPPYLNNLTFSGKGSDSGGYSIFIDAVGYNWDVKYNIGDNLKEGLLLSFENSTNLDWMGYSVDGQANKTILGNTTIRMLAAGSHRIQVFSNDSLGTIYQSDIRYFTVSPINLITPENKTYTGLMSGYYPATYGFENDKHGKFPTGWFNASDAGCSVEVQAVEIDEHINIVKLTDNSGEGGAVMKYTLSQTTGSIEFWILLTSTTHAQHITFYESGIIRLTLSWSATGMFRYYNGFSHDIESYSANTWYHIRIDFNCVSDNSKIYRNGTVVASPTLNGDAASISDILIFTQTDSDGFSFYVDAIGFSWDDNYNIGDNREEGLLLSFENITTLDWMGYSLDGQANKKILGNTTIPMPARGPHTIQVFGNDSLGTMYQSDVRYFIVSPINIITPENKTYTGPMSGYYPATYGFENDKHGKFPTGWFNASDAGCSVEVQAVEIDEHINIVKLTDNSGEGGAVMKYTLSQTTGSIEFWILLTSTTHAQHITFYESGIIRLTLSWSATGMFRYYNGFSHDIESYSANTWYHIRIDFNCVSDNSKIYRNGTVVASPTLNGDAASISDILIFTQTDSDGFSFYVDAIGFSWDDNYNIGDNREEGLLLSFENITTLDWMVYSLDRQANKKILGNTTIPIPADGPHTIQLFCNDSLGRMSQSDLRYFKIDYWHLPYLIVDTLNIVDLRSQYGVYLEVKTNAIGNIEVSNQTSKFMDTDDIWNFLKAHMFYSFKIYDKNMQENSSIIEYIVIRFYYNNSDVGKLSNLYILHYIYDAVDMRMEWRSEDLTFYTNLKYVEINITKLSYFCLAEWVPPPPTPPPPDDDDDDGKDSEEANFGFWLLIILLLIIIGIGIITTTAYVIKYKGKKETKPKKRLPLKEKPREKKKKRVKKKSKKEVKKGEYINCPYCFSKIRSTENFCSYCDSPLKETDDEKFKIFEESVKEIEKRLDIDNLLEKNFTVNILRVNLPESEEINVLLNKIFETKEEKDFIKSEIARLPFETVECFIKSYKRLIKELGMEKPKYDFNNDNYFSEGKGK